jgi:hypothetical protein
MPDILTPPVISTLPLGLLRYLGIQSGGRFPQTVEGVISPGLELIELLAASTDVTVADSAVAITSAGTKLAAGLIVAQAKVVRVSQCGLRVATAAGEAVKLGIVLVKANGGTVNLSGTATLAASTGDQLVCAVPFWMQPGDQLAAQVYTVTTAGTINANITITKSDFFF